MGHPLGFGSDADFQTNAIRQQYPEYLDIPFAEEIKNATHAVSSFIDDIGEAQVLKELSNKTKEAVVDTVGEKITPYFSNFATLNDVQRVVFITQPTTRDF